MEAAAELDSYVDKEKIKEKRDKERQKERARVEKDKENDEGNANTMPAEKCTRRHSPFFCVPKTMEKKDSFPKSLKKTGKYRENMINRYICVTPKRHKHCTTMSKCHDSWSYVVMSKVSLLSYRNHQGLRWIWSLAQKVFSNYHRT